MDASVDNDGADNLLTTVSSAAEERKSSDAECTFTDVKLPENGEITSESISDNFAADGNIDTNCCVKSNASSSSSLVMCENDVSKSTEDKMMTDCHDVNKECGYVKLDPISGRNDNTDGDDDDGEIADSRSQTPLQDEVEPEIDELNQSKAGMTSNTELDSFVAVNPLHDFAVKTETACTKVHEGNLSAVQSSREENGEVSDDDDEGTAESQVTADAVTQQLPVDVKSLVEEKLAKESETQKVSCMLV